MIGVWLAGSLDPADLAGGLVAVHLGHLAVHQDGVVGSGLDRADRLAAVVGDVERVAELGEHLGSHQLVHRVVLDQQDRAHHRLVIRLDGRSGRSTGRSTVPPLRPVIRQSNSSDERTGLVMAAGEAPRDGTRPLRAVRRRSSAGTGRSARSPDPPSACSASSMPSMPGMLRSITPRSNALSGRRRQPPQARAPGRPSTASTASMPQDRSCWRRIRRLVALSSTTSARCPIRLVQALGARLWIRPASGCRRHRRAAATARTRTSSPRPGR